MNLATRLRQPYVDLRERLIGWITRLEQPAAHEIEITRRRIYILPTRHGYLFALILVVMLAAATNYSNSMTFLLTFLLVSLGGNTMWQTHRNLLRLRVISLGATPVFAGQHAHFRLALDNPTNSPRLGLQLRIGEQPPVSVDVGAHERVELTLPCPTERRGLHRLGRVRLSTRWPLGLFEAWSWPSYTTAVIVYPKAAEDAPPVSGLADSSLGGRPIAREGDEFAGLRKYAHSDSPRHIAWKAVARTGRLLTKEFQLQATEDSWLRWDELERYVPEQRLSILCRWVLDAHRRGDHYGLELPGRRIPPGAGEQHRHECLKQLALFRLPTDPGAP